MLTTLDKQICLLIDQ